MNPNDCHDVEAMLGPYLDSELDTRTALELSLHLKDCPACAARLAGETAWHQRLKAALNEGAPAEGLWAPIEGQIRKLTQSTSMRTQSADASPTGPAHAADVDGGAAPSPASAPAEAPSPVGRERAGVRVEPPRAWIVRLLASGRGLRYWLWPSPRFYAGLAVAWALILGVQVGTHEPGRAVVVSTPETRTALAEQRHLLAELLGTITPDAEPVVSRPPPQTDTRRPGPDPGLVVRRAPLHLPT